MAADKFLRTLYCIQAKSGKEDQMITYLETVIPKLGSNIKVETIDRNIYVTKGEADNYPCICAHTDQVQQPNENLTVIEHNGTLLAYDFIGRKPAGLGADDKNGIYLALLAIREFPAIKAVFFHGEETGCLGSKACDISFFDDCRFVVQCDRKGSSDFIIQGNGIDLSSEEFETDCELEKYGYKEANGASTDVVALKQRGLKVSCCNLSCGYYDPHTDHEYTVWNDLVKCWLLVKHILSLTKTYPHEYVAPKYTFSHTTNWKATSEFSGKKSSYVHENEKPKSHNTLTYGYCQTRIATNRKSIVEKITSGLVLDLQTQRHNAEILLQSYYEMSDFMPSKGNLKDLFDDNKCQFKDITYNEFTEIYEKLVRSYGYN